MNKLKTYTNIPNIFLLIVLILAVFAQTLPLIQVLNFEFSFVFSIILFLTSGILTIHFLRKFKTLGMLPAIVRIKYKNYLAIFLSPLLISIISNLFLQICPFSDGIIYYFVIVLPAFYFGFVVGTFSFWTNKQYSYLIFCFIFVFFVLAPLFEFYIYPQVYFFNVIVGIIPGTIYDEEILINSKLILFRVIQFVLFSILLFSLIKVSNTNKKNRYLLMLCTLFGAVLFFLLKPYLGYATTKYKLYDNLKMRVLSTSFEIRYSDNLNEKDAQLIGFEHFYYISEIERKTKLSTPKNLITYIFKNANQKGKLFGSKAANVAKPWMNQIFLDYNSVENTLEHELTHIYAAEIGSTPFKIAGGLNMALLEGYTMAIEDNYSGYDIHYMALLAKESGYDFNIKKLFSKFNFFNQTSSLSYVISGSFIKFIIERYGIEKVNKIYGDLDFELHLGKKIDELEIEYKEYLVSLNYPINKHRANLFFGRSPITKKVCPRTVANDLNFAWKLFNEQSYYSSLNAFKSIFKYSNSYSALIGVIYSNNKIGLYSESLEILNSKMNEFVNTASYYSALLHLGNQLSLVGKFEKADSVYNQLFEFKPTVLYKNIAKIRVELIKNCKINYYLNGSDFDKYEILKSLNESHFIEESIPILINLSEQLDENNDRFYNYLEKLPTESISSNSAYEISKYLMKNYRYQESLKYAEIAVKKCSKRYELPIYKSHFRKAKWFGSVKS